MDVNVLTICIIEIIGFVLLLGLLIANLVKSTLKLIAFGDQDEAIIKEYNEKKQKNSKKQLAVKIINIIVISILWIVLLLTLITTISITALNGKRVGDLPVLKTVESGSMSYVHKNNKYVEENGLNDQIQIHDLIVLKKLPDAEDIELYDIVLYERDGHYILHRVVGIIEPGVEAGINERRFILQGDAVAYPDAGYVTYDDMKGIYDGTRLPYIGLFISFMQTPIGYTCFAIVIVVSIVGTIVDKKIEDARKKRYLVCTTIQKETAK